MPIDETLKNYIQSINQKVDKCENNNYEVYMITPNFDWLNHMRIPPKEVSITYNDPPSEIVADSLFIKILIKKIN